jgi:hypothetical protein
VLCVVLQMKILIILCVNAGLFKKFGSCWVLLQSMFFFGMKVQLGYAFEFGIGTTKIS